METKTLKSQVVRCIASGVLWTGVAALAAENGSAITEFPLPHAASRPYAITAGPDGNLWFTESDGNRIGRISPRGDLTEFPVPTPGSGPYGITAGPDGNLWFTERFADQIGRITPSGVITEFRVPTPFSQPWEIAAGPDGNLWFTEEEGNQIGRVTPQGSITEFPTGTCCFPTGIAPGADGNVWFTVEIGDQIGRITPGGVTTTFQIETVQVLPWDIAPGPDGNVWFTELAGRNIGRITPDGVIAEFPVAGEFSGIAGISTGADGNLWFTENDTDHVGALTPDGTVVELFDVGSRPLGVILGPDGNLWFTEADGNAIGRVNAAPPGASFVLSLAAGFAPSLRRAALGDLLQWTFFGPGVHSVVDTTGLDLFDSGPRSIVSTYVFELTAAGRYFYRDETSPHPTGRLAVAPDVPGSATVGVPFPVVWATRAPAGGRVFDVQVRVPGAANFSPWLVGAEATEAEYTPQEPGPYRFRSRMRDPDRGASLRYSPSATVAVGPAPRR